MTQVDDLSRSLVAFEQNSCRAPCSGIAKGTRKTGAIVALARKLLIMLWRMVNTGQIPQDLVLRPAMDEQDCRTQRPRRPGCGDAPMTIRGSGDPT